MGKPSWPRAECLAVPQRLELVTAAAVLQVDAWTRRRPTDLVGVARGACA